MIKYLKFFQFSKNKLFKGIKKKFIYCFNFYFYFILGEVG
jgi:hypothetical protein